MVFAANVIKSSQRAAFIAVIKGGQTRFRIITEAEQHYGVRISLETVIAGINGAVVGKAPFPQFKALLQFSGHGEVCLGCLPEGSVVPAGGNVVQRQKITDTINHVSRVPVVALDGFLVERMVR